LLALREGGRAETLKGVKLDRKRYGLADDGVGLSYIQIDALLEVQLPRLWRPSVDEIHKELAQIREKIAELKEILGSDKRLKQVIVGELREVQKEFGDDRRTHIE